MFNPLPSNFKLDDKRMILEVFVTTDTDNFKMQVWRIPSRGNTYDISLHTLVDIGEFAKFMKMPRVKVNRGYTVSQLLTLCGKCYNECLKAMVASKSIVEKTAEEKRKEMFLENLVTIEKRIPVIEEVIKIGLKNEMSTKIDIGHYQRVDLSL